MHYSLLKTSYASDDSALENQSIQQKLRALLKNATPYETVIHGYNLFYYCLIKRYFSLSEYLEMIPIDCEIDRMKYFLGKRGRVLMYKEVNSRMSESTVSALDNKLLTNFVLSQHFSRDYVTTNQAVFCMRGAHIECRILKNEIELSCFLKNEAKYPIFCKPLDSMGSFGAISIDSYSFDSNTLLFLDGTRADLAQFVDEVARAYPGGYLIQNRIRQHPDVEALSGKTVSTLRVVTYRDEGEIRIAYAYWKVAAPTAMADNSWRPGSVIVALDPVTGIGWRAQIGYGPDARLVQRHEASGRPLVGVAPPHWEAARDAALKASAIFGDATMIAWDIALGEDGPILVEGNKGPAHMLYQRASGRGVLTTPLGPLWERCAAQVASARREERRRRRKQRLLRLGDRTIGMLKRL